MNNDLAAIILAAGKGKRMNAKKVNKVAMNINDKPMILHTLHLLESLHINEIIVVVGFAKNSVIKLLDNNVKFVEQKKQLGTAHAVTYAIKEIPSNVKNVLVLNGDDSAFYTKPIIEKLIRKHVDDNSDLTFLTIDKDNPFGLGRVIRNKNGQVEAIVEEKDSTLIQKRIKEVNPACYLFKVEFLKHYLPKVEKSLVTGEYYLTSLINIGVENKRKIETIRTGNIPWVGVNTKEDLQEAQKLFNN